MRINKIANHADRETTAVYEKYIYDAETRNALYACGNKLKLPISNTEDPSISLILKLFKST